MTPLRQHMHDAMLVRGFAARTRQAYIEAITHLARFHHASPDRLTAAHVEAWLLHLVAERKLSYTQYRSGLSCQRRVRRTNPPLAGRCRFRLLLPCR